jgi:hypothetical protein
VAKLCSDNETALLDHKTHITDLMKKFNEFKTNMPEKYDDSAINKSIKEMEMLTKEHGT